MARPRRRGGQQRAWILWPSYFDARLSRAQGRRVAREQAVRNPKLAELTQALKTQGLEATEQPKAAHPSFWSSPQGRLKVPRTPAVSSKEQLLKETARQLKQNRQSSD